VPILFSGILQGKKTMAISIIVPVLDEALRLRQILSQLRSSSLSSEIIVVDGGSKDASLEIARELADRVLESSRRRAVQMNAGAQVARNDILWFVHADSTVAPTLPAAIEKALANQRVVGGCFRLRLDSPGIIYRIRDTIGDLLVGVSGIALGDRGIFCRRETFLAVGGYPEISILEDAEFYRSLKRHGRLVRLNETIGSSARRYEALGAAPTMLFYSFVMLLYAMRVPMRFLETLVRAYMTSRASCRLRYSSDSSTRSSS
jgi:rSAM/selenodomain-associated transferase 2